jgi:hypothetical protein
VQDDVQAGGIFKSIGRLHVQGPPEGLCDRQSGMTSIAKDAHDLAGFNHDVNLLSAVSHAVRPTNISLYIDMTRPGRLVARGQAKIVSLIQEFRVPLEHGQPIGASQAKMIQPVGYQRLVATIEEQLYRYVLLKLQTIGGGSDPFIHELPSGIDPRGQGSPRMFAGRIRLRPGAAGHLVRFEPLLRPLIQQRWAQHVARLRTPSGEFDAAPRI